MPACYCLPAHYRLPCLPCMCACRRRVVYVTADSCMIGTLVTLRVIKALQVLGVNLKP